MTTLSTTPFFERGNFYATFIFQPRALSLLLEISCQRIFSHPLSAPRSTQNSIPVVDADQPAARLLRSPEQHRSHRGIPPLLRQPPQPPRGLLGQLCRRAGQSALHR